MQSVRKFAVIPVVISTCPLFISHLFTTVYISPHFVSALETADMISRCRIVITKLYAM